MIEVVQLHSINDIPRDEWNGLVKQSEFDNIFLTHEWMTSWWDIFGADYELLLYAAKENDILLGLAPMMIHSRIMEFVSTGEADYSDFIATSERKSEVLKAFFDQFHKVRKRFDLMILENIPDRSITPQFLRDYGRNLFPMMRDWISNQCPALIIRGNEEFVLSCLRKNDVKTRFNYLNKNGKLEYKIAETPDEILRELDTLFKLHEERRFIAGGQSKFDNPKPREFYKKLIDVMLPLGWLRFDSLKFNDEPLAYHFGFYYGDTLYHYTPTFNLDYYKRSPGTVIIKFMIEDCLKRNAKEFDFTRGAEQYKKRFANLSRDNFRFEIYTNPIAWNIANWTSSIKEWLKNRHPRILSKLKSGLNSARISDIKNEIKYSIQKNGILRTVFKIAQASIGDFIYHSSTAIIFRKTLGDETTAQNSSFTIREGRLSDLYGIVEGRTQLRRRQFLPLAFQRLNDGERLFVVEKNNRIVHYSWAITTNKFDLIEIRSHYNLENKVGYIYHCFTIDDARGYGIYPAVLRHICEVFKSDGLQEVYIYCMDKNIASMKGIEKAGFKRLTTRGLTRILGIPFKR